MLIKWNSPLNMQLKLVSCYRYNNVVTSIYIRMVHENSLRHFHREHTGRRSPGSGRIPQDTSRRNLSSSSVGRFIQNETSVHSNKKTQLFRNTVPLKSKTRSTQVSLTVKKDLLVKFTGYAAEVTRLIEFSPRGARLRLVVGLRQRTQGCRLGELGEASHKKRQNKTQLPKHHLQPSVNELGAAVSEVGVVLRECMYGAL